MSQDLHSEIGVPQHISGHWLFRHFCTKTRAASVNYTESYGTQVVKLWMNLKQLIMFTSRGGTGYHWGFMSQKLFNFPPECGKTKELFYADFSLSTETDPSLLYLLGIPPDIRVPAQLLDDIQERPWHDPGCQGGWLVVMVQPDRGRGDVVLTVHLLWRDSSTLALLSERRICFCFTLLCNFAILSFLGSLSVGVYM